MISTQEITLDFVKKHNVVFYAKQYDSNTRQIIVSCQCDEEDVQFDSSCKANLVAYTSEGDRYYFDDIGVIRQNQITFFLPFDITYEIGKTTMSLSVLSEDICLGTFNFYVIVEKSPYTIVPGASTDISFIVNADTGDVYYSSRMLGTGDKFPAFTLIFNEETGECSYSTNTENTLSMDFDTGEIFLNSGGE